MVKATSTATPQPVAMGYGPQQPHKFDKPLLANRIVQLILSLVVLGLVAAVTAANKNYCANTFDGLDYVTICYTLPTPSNWAFNLFAAAWTILCLIYLLPATLLPRWHSPIATIVLDALTLIFWLVAFGLLASFDEIYTDYFNGGYVTSGVGMLIGATVIGALLFISFVACLVLESVKFHQSRQAAMYNDPSSITMGQVQPGQQGVAQHPGATHV